MLSEGGMDVHVTHISALVLMRMGNNPLKLCHLIHSRLRLARWTIYIPNTHAQNSQLLWPLPSSALFPKLWHFGRLKFPCDWRIALMRSAYQLPANAMVLVDGTSAGTYLDHRITARQ